MNDLYNLNEKLLMYKQTVYFVLFFMPIKKAIINIGMDIIIVSIVNILCEIKEIQNYE